MAKVTKEQQARIDGGVFWIQSFNEETRYQAQKDAAVNSLGKVDEIREAKLVSYGTDHVKLCEEVTIGMEGFKGTADQKKTLKRSMARAMRRASDAQFTLTFKENLCTVTPFEETSQKSEVDRAINVLSNHIPDEHVQIIRQTVTDGITALKLEKERIKRDADKAYARVTQEQAEILIAHATGLLEKAGREVTDENLLMTVELLQNMQ